MSTISVPLTAELMNQLDTLVKNSGASRAAIMRKALEKLAEDEAINAILVARKEPTLHGNLRDLLKSI